VGLYLTHKQAIIEACPEGVILTPLEAFCMGEIYLTRIEQPLSPTQSDTLQQRAEALLHKPYNSSYAPSQTAIYCSELLILLFEDLTAKPLFERHPMSFNHPSTQLFDERWLQYYAKKDEIPMQAMGSHPNYLFQSKGLRLIQSFDFSKQQH
jgi:hypothetical protein